MNTELAKKLQLLKSCAGFSAVAIGKQFETLRNGVAELHTVEKAKANLLKVLFAPSDSDKALIEKAVEQYRQLYQKLPHQYPGDDSVYDFFTRLVATGKNVDQTYNEFISIMDKEVNSLTINRALGYR